jgi:hypothetical protein
MVTHAQLSAHRTRESLWVVADGFVIDITEFVSQHPGGLAKILSATQNTSFSFKSHFGSTYQAFTEACQCFDGEPLPFSFENSRANGGLDNSGNVTGRARGFVGTVTIIGPLKQSESVS